MSWTCPYCNRPQVVTKDNSYHTDNGIYVGYKSTQHLTATAIRCLAPDCRRMTLSVALCESKKNGNYSVAGDVTQVWRLLPSSFAKPQPDFIPKALRNDYHEACVIRDLSPKASATLARRCLQGMIRDFCKIQGGTLDWEIKELRRQIEAHEAPRAVTLESIDAIDHVRKIGNIGAHMEKDIDLIIEVDPGEAQALIELIELLFEEWYVEQHNRELRLNRVKQIRDEKDAILKAGKHAPALPIDELGGEEHQ